MNPDLFQQLYSEALQAGDDELAAAYLQQFQQSQQAVPMIRPPAPPTPFQPPSVTREAMRAEAEEIGQQLTAGRVGSPLEIAEERERETQRALEVIQAERSRPVETGRGPVREERTFVPSVPVTRLQRLPVYRELPEELVNVFTPEQRADYETREPTADAATEPIRVSTYIQTDDGIRRPTTTEMAAQAFTRQPVLTEAQARQQAEMQEDELRRFFEGERATPPLAALPASVYLTALTQRREEDAGIVETGAGALTRAATTFLGPLAAETIGLFTDQTARTAPEPTPFDPEARRRASNDPDFMSRVFENVATGRGVSDELYDIEAFRTAAGDVAAGALGEDYRAAGEAVPFYLGLGADVASPGFIGTATMATRGARLATAPVVNRAVAQVARPQVRQQVATRIINQSNLDQPEKVAALEAIRASDRTEEGIRTAVQPTLDAALGSEGTDAFMAEVQRRMPDDYVFVTDRIAVPRETSTAAQAAVRDVPQNATRRAPAAQAEYLRTLAALADDTSDQASTRLSALIDGTFAPSEAPTLRGAQFSGASPDTLEALRRSAEALEAKPTRTATIAAENALARFEAETGIGQGTLQNRFRQRLPAESANRLPEGIRQQVRQAESWTDLPADVRQQAFDALADQTAIDIARAGGLTPRTAGDLSSLQVRLVSDNPLSNALRRISDGQLSRWVRSTSGKPLPSASVSRAVQKIRAASEAAVQTMGRQVRQLVQETGSLNAGHEQYLLRSTPDLSNRDRWEKVLDALYGEPKALLDQGDSLFSDVGGLENVPVTVANVRQLHAQLRSAIKKGTYLLPTPLQIPVRAIRQSMLKAGLDEGTRRRLLAEGVAYERSIADSPVLPGRPRWAALMGDPVEVPSASGGVRTYGTSDIIAARTEKLLAEQSPELTPYIERLSKPSRASWSGLLTDVADYAVGGLNAAYQNITRYGYAGIPNLPVILYRMTEAPILSLATIGTENTLRALGRLPSTVVNEAMRKLGMRRLGGPLTTPSGRVYSPGELDALAERGGIGITRADQSRAALLARDLERMARRATRGAAGRALGFVADQFNPFARGFWLETAHALNRSYRRSVMEGALAAGLPEMDALRLARESLGDYGGQPKYIQDAGRYLASAQHNYLLMTEAVQLGLRNPMKLEAIGRAALANQKVQDPYALDGDASLSRLGVVRAGQAESAQRFYGPENPFFVPVEQVTSSMRNANLVVADLIRMGRALKAQDYPTAANTFVEGGVNLISIPLPVFAQALDYAGIETAAAQTLADPVSAERVFWQTMAAARAADPDGSRGIWSAWDAIAMPKKVPPPEGSAHPTLPDYWVTQPPAGTPHVLYAYELDADGVPRPLYAVYEPSPRGMQQIELLRAATPDLLERAFGASAALIDMPAAYREAGTSISRETPPVQVFGESVVPRGVGAAIGTLAGQPAGPADTVAARRAQIEILRQTREGQ